MNFGLAPKVKRTNQFPGSATSQKKMFKNRAGVHQKFIKINLYICEKQTNEIN